MAKAERFFFGGATLHFRVLGTAGQPPLVLVHGLSGSHRWWARNLPALTPHFQVYVLDLAGYGTGWRERSLGVRDSAALIGAWLEVRDLQGVTLLGHSMGGQIATLVAAAHPERLRALVLACASGLLDTTLYHAALQLPRAAVTGRASFIPTVLLDSLRAGPVNVVKNTLDLLGNPTADLLPGIRTPTLVVWGARDALVPAHLGRALAGALPNSRYVEVPRAGHVVMVDAPEAFNKAVLDFLQDVYAQDAHAPASPA